ncbi:diadenylate cyclase CdaA [Chloroflexi bacterium TSY]|nr:diadenylate cyclase CdaA [Chloroflexi bacterium TSY]
MSDIVASISRLQDWLNIIDVTIVALIIFGVLRLFRGTQAIQLVRGILVIALIVLVIGQTVELTAVNWLLRSSFSVLLVALPVIFQPELRRALERVGRSAPLLMRRANTATTQLLVNEIVQAVEELARYKHGALIVFESTTGLGEYIDQGITLDAELSSELLLTIFAPNTALHDGAVIIRNERIGAAGCILPLTQRDPGDSQLGTRHRAAIGLTEQVDALVIVVSEETGTISAARSGRILRLDPGRIRPLLNDFYK